MAFFIYDCPFAQGRGRGERIRPLPQLNSLRLWHVLAVPDIRVSTAAIYRAWDTRSKKRNSPKRVTLTIPRFNDKISALRLKKCSDVSLRGLLHNDLQAVTSSFYPEVRQIQDTFKQLGLKSVLMSGSGPAVFATVSSGKEAAALCRQLKKRRHSWLVFRVRTR